MKKCYKNIIIFFVILISLSSCNLLEKASLHGFNSGYYQVNIDQKKSQNVYLDITDEKIDLYNLPDTQKIYNLLLTIPLKSSDSLINVSYVFSKQSLDIDITSILLKYRPSASGLPSELNSDFNLALYAGWRQDTYDIENEKNPLGKSQPKISNFGYDFGIFVGPGTTTISPFTTRNKREDEYSGMIIQTGIAGFIESDVASFGVSVGFDYLLSPDRAVWIYNKKPWVGFIVGIALN